MRPYYLSVWNVSHWSRIECHQYANYFNYSGTSAIAVEKTLRAEWVAIPAHDGSSGSSLVKVISELFLQSDLRVIHRLQTSCLLLSDRFCVSKDWTCIT